MNSTIYSFSNVLPAEAEKSRELQQRGYTVQPFLDAGDIQALDALHRETTPAVPADYYVSAFGSDVATKRRIFEGIVTVVQDKVKMLAPGYRILMASFVTKRAKSTKGRLGIHQDYSLVDHTRNLGLNVWCPLCGVDNRNGCLRVVEGSQVFGHISATPPNPSPYDSVRKDLDAGYLVDVPMAAGSAFLFDTRVLHATDDNVTEMDRTSVFLNLVPESATPRLYMWNKLAPAKLEFYEVDSNFMLQLPPNQYIENADQLGARFVGLIDYTYETLTSSSLTQILPRPLAKGAESSNDNLARSAPDALTAALRQAVVFLSKSQLPDGEFQTEFRAGTHQDAYGQIVEDLVFDSSPFVTSLVLYSLQFARTFDAGVRKTIERGCHFLQAEMEPGGLWRYWSRKNGKRALIPPDLDDTACISHLLMANGFSVPSNRGIFHDSRDSKGAFYTWLYTANSLRKKILWLRTRGQAFSYRDQIWRWTGKDDVCAVVNANVVLYLGETVHTRAAIAYLKNVIRQSSEDKDIIFYAHRMSLYYMLSRAYFCGVTAFEDVKSALVERVSALRQPDGSFGDELLTGMAICSLLNLDPAPRGLEGAVQFLIRTQRPDGSWKRIPAYGGPPAPTTFGSADLTTGICLEALARSSASPGNPPA
jgi:hypothetical protein